MWRGNVLFLIGSNSVAADGLAVSLVVYFFCVLDNVLLVLCGFTDNLKEETGRDQSLVIRRMHKTLSEI